MSANTDAVEASSTSSVSAEELLVALKALSSQDPRAVALCERVMDLYRPLVQRIARRYDGRGEPYEDLKQTAMLGLVKAIHGYDPERGKPFISYLLPTVTGEIKRHFRDHTWAVRVPRRHQENRSQLRRVTGEFQQAHARTPTTSELALAMGISEAEVRELTQVSAAYRSLSLDAPDASGSDRGTAVPLEDHLGSEDEALERVVERESIKPALARLPERERTILMLRFFGDHTQSEIAEALGYSQMHVSRLLAGVLDQLRREVVVDPARGDGRSRPRRTPRTPPP
ncbi:MULTISPECIES: SigB/SigF/SigG family RNA polymerase sigma factor [Nocardiopsis]|uniref:Flagellar biosynthesis protein FliA n=1 Tax=Nocardiopsis sinuspersici TaxID=501010 RepID=A0A1V3BYA8_9ACTN|nr:MULTISPECIES: SigB/SigF/SigG family RNA polymerase sigma factor [Nocardiopsis]NYH54763.1 RNA polymerase sigma-B factor [Nocardiopsis sinuspersici]OOC53521.1 flagellar biosynthesis protein FliA [Nocardiopsis sinuspersici]